MDRDTGVKGRPVLALLLALQLLASASAQADAGAADGRQIFLHGAPNGIIPCAACHGMQGEGRPDMGVPRLAGQPAATLLAKLGAIANGGGDNAVMRRIAARLTPGQREAVANALAAMPPPLIRDRRLSP